VFDPISSSGALDAFEELTGQRALPTYKFAEVKTVVSIGADFLGDWLAADYATDFAKSRDPKQDKMSRHIQVESLMSLTGANADSRYMVKPSEQLAVLVKLYNEVSGESLPANSTSLDSKIKDIAAELKNSGSESLVVVGANDKNAQLIAMKLNMALKSKAMCLGKPSFVKESNDGELMQFMKDLSAGKVGVVLTSDVNPAYSCTDSEQFKSAIAKADFRVSMSQFEDETSELMNLVLPSQHSLESWGDAMPIDGEYVLMQPTIRPMYDSRQLQDNLLSWALTGKKYYDFLKDFWKSDILVNKTGATWNQSLHDGVFSYDKAPEMPSINDVNLSKAAEELNKKYKASGIELELYVKTSMGNGDMANNPWLQELPDPITRTSWDNYLTISPKLASELGVRNWNESNGALNGDIVKLSNGNYSVEVPVFIQPGQANATVGLALGFGRSKGVKQEMQTGVNAYPFNLNHSNFAGEVKIEKVEGEHEFACVQLHHTMMDRDVVQETTFDIFKSEDKSVWNPAVELETHKGKQPVSKIDLWQAQDRSTGHHFNLSIDLNTCTGCAACVVACHAENNVPVVGKEEVRRSRDMHWLRIDRYYSSDMTKEKAKEEGYTGVSGAIDMYAEMEIASENPEVVFQPVMCQHCNHAPCETVCPVAATSHGKEGQNQMAYNRCVGTRYCANNCPYKVRRFNWFQYAQNEEFDYHFNDEVGRLVINPDVTVRSRGVMEKCSMCIQITQAGKLAAKKDGRKLEDADIQTACASACPSNAIAFGDINDENSSIQESLNDDRKYYLLESIGTKPNVMYQTKIRNKNS
jgi:Fe-S-cluster-containing dehydrogenase component